tara:strand:+ start:1877 stop:2104 length:228 start_codon:yes stop_codon:yes gene_type:complete
VGIDPAKFKSEEYARRKADPAPEAIAWLLKVNTNATRLKTPTKWVQSALKGGPDCAAYLAPGFGVDPSLKETNRG